MSSSHLRHVLLGTADLAGSLPPPPLAVSVPATADHHPTLASLGLHPGQEALLLELDRTSPMIQAELSEALGCEPPSVTLMTGKLEASGHIRRKPAPSDKRASIVELTDSGKALADQVKQLWCALAEETVTGLPAQTVAELPGVLKTLTGNVDTRRPRHPHGRRDGG